MSRDYLSDSLDQVGILIQNDPADREHRMHYPVLSPVVYLAQDCEHGDHAHLDQQRYVTLGELDKGCETLARAVGDHSLLLGWMRLDPRLDPLRGRQCFSDVEKRIYPLD